MQNETKTNETVQGTAVVLNENQLSSGTPEKVFEVLTLTDLNWSVRKEKLVSVTGLQTPNMGVFRSDNNEWLGTVSDKYTPYQNHELVTTIVEASHQIGLDIAKGGCLKGGRNVFVQIELKKANIGKSEVKRYITAMNSHNGKSSVAFGSTNMVVACENMFYKVYKELQKFRHTKSTAEQIKLAVIELKNTINADVKLMQTFEMMASMKIEDEVVSNVMKNTFKIDMNKSHDELGKRKVERSEVIFNAIAKEKGLAGDSLWGLFNGITRYTNHDSKHKRNKTDHLMTGKGYKQNLIAFDTIVKWIEQNTTELAPVNA